jgi:hypothetical protein
MKMVGMDVALLSIDFVKNLNFIIEGEKNEEAFFSFNPCIPFGC